MVASDEKNGMSTGRTTDGRIVPVGIATESVPAFIGARKIGHYSHLELLTSLPQLRLFPGSAMSKGD
jgi:hypothetical protein